MNAFQENPTWVCKADDIALEHTNILFFNNGDNELLTLKG